jgi:hypothetical protein
MVQKTVTARLLTCGQSNHFGHYNISKSSPKKGQDRPLSYYMSFNSLILSR